MQVLLYNKMGVGEAQQGQDVEKELYNNECSLKGNTR